MRLSYIHQAYGYGKNYIPCGGSNSGPSGRESSALTARPGSFDALVSYSVIVEISISYFLYFTIIHPCSVSTSSEELYIIRFYL